jgi:hypothetical protein
MTPSEAEKDIRSRILVTAQMVVIAKAIILDAAKTISRTSSLIDAVLVANESALPDQLVLHSSVDATSSVKATGEALSWQLAAKEALWSLIHSGFLLSMSDTIAGDPVTVKWTTVISGSGGETASWQFGETRIPIPHAARLSPSNSGISNQFLCEPDLYLHSFGVPNMHPDVGRSFTEAVKCFRAELFTAALAMLGKASEGSWLEMGEALIGRTPPVEAKRFLKQQVVLEDHNAGPMKKVEAAIAIYEHADLFGDVYKLTGIRPQKLKEISVWSDAVRDSRNTIHFGVDAAIPNTYEKLAALLIGAVPNVRTLYRVKAAADQP